MLPIENSIEGAVSTTLDLLIHETTLKIAAESVVQVRHFLVTSLQSSDADCRNLVWLIFDGNGVPGGGWNDPTALCDIVDQILERLVGVIICLADC